MFDTGRDLQSYDGKFTEEQSRAFDNPFILPSNSSFPTEHKNALDLALYLYFMNPDYSRGARSIVSYFVNDITFRGEEGDADERAETKKYLYHTLQMKEYLQAKGEGCNCFGNAFTRVHLPFDRYLLYVKNDGLPGEMALSAFPRERLTFNIGSLTYEGPDIRDVSAGRATWASARPIRYRFRDRPSVDESRVSLRPIDPRRMLLWHSTVSGRTQYIWRFDEHFVRDVKKGIPYQVDETPIAMLRAIAANQDYLFFDDEIFHLKCPTICGVSNMGWGLPATIANYRNLHQVQLYRKIDETVALDYLLPFRIFSPNAQGMQAGQAGTDVLNQQWNYEMQKMIAARRRDKMAMFSLPFPVVYQEAGATGRQLAPVELHEGATDRLLTGMGVPVDLQRGRMNLAMVPTTSSIP